MHHFKLINDAGLFENASRKYVKKKSQLIICKKSGKLALCFGALHASIHARDVLNRSKAATISSLSFALLPRLEYIL